MSNAALITSANYVCLSGYRYNPKNADTCATRSSNNLRHFAVNIHARIQISCHSDASLKSLGCHMLIIRCVRAGIVHPTKVNIKC